MSDNLLDLFNNRVSQELAREQLSGVSTKYEEVQQASRDKTNRLEEARLKQIAIQEANKKSFIAKLGLDNDSALGTGANVLASSVAGVTDTFGANLDQYVAADEHTGLKDSSIQRRVGDVGISALKSAITVPEGAVGLASMVSGGQAGKILNDAGFRPEEAKAFLDTLYSHEQKAANENVHGAEGFWNTMAQIAENPSTVPHALIESLFPMLAGGVAGRGLEALGVASKMATAGGEGLVMAGSNAEGIRNQTDDKLLTAKQSLMAALTAPMGMAVSRGGMAVGGKAGFGDIDEAIVRGTFGKSKHGATVNTAGSGALEAAEEGLQSTGETMLSNVALDKELTTGVGNAAAVGMVTGAAMGAPMGLAANGAKKAPPNVLQRVAADRPTFDAAVAANDPSVFLDPALPTFDPGKGLAVLMQNNKSTTATPETKATNLKRATEIVSDLDSGLQTAKDMLAQAKDLSPEEVVIYTQAVAEREARLAAIDPADVETLEQTKQGLDEAAQLLALQDVKAQELKQFEINQMDRDALEARKIYNAMAGGREVAAKAKELLKLANTKVDAIDTAAVAASRTAAEGIISLSMKSPTAVSHTEAQELADNKDNVLTTEQRSYLRSFAASRVAENKLKTDDNVNQEIYHGSAAGKKGTKYIGIKQYQDTIGDAIKLNNVKKATTALAALTKFAKEHTSKAEAITAAVAKLNGKVPMKSVQVIRDTSGNWSVNTGALLDKEALDKDGGLTIHSGSTKLINGVPVEAEALTKAAASLKLVVDMAFRSKPTASVTPAAQTPATPSSAASVPSAEPKVEKVKEQPKADTEKAVVATAKTAEAVEVKEEKKKEVVPIETKPVDSAPPKEVTSPAPLIDRTDENSGSTVRPDETSGEATQEDPTSDTKTQDEAPAASPDGTLKVFAKRLVSKDGETVNELYHRVDENGVRLFNQVAQFLKQSKVNEEDASVRPLVAVEDFISNWTAGNVKAEDYLDLGTEGNTRKLTEEEDSALKNLQAFINEWMPKLQKNFLVDKTKDIDFRSDLMQDFYTVDETTGVVTVEENVKAALAYAMYSYILDKVNSPALKTKKEVATMHERLLKDNAMWDEDNPMITPEGMELLQIRDVFEETLVNDLGQRVIQALGVINGTKNTPIDLLPRLAVAFGTHAMLGLAYNEEILDGRGFPTGEVTPSFIDIDHISRKNVYEAFGIPYEDKVHTRKNDDGTARLNSDGELDQVIIGESISYIKFNYTAEKRADGSINKYGLSNIARPIRDANTGSSAVVDKLFGVTHTPLEALDTPTDMKQETTAKQSKQEVSKLQTRAIDKTQKEPHTLIQAMWALKDKFGEMTILKAAGWKEINEDDPNVHLINRKGTEAQNRNLESQLDLASAMLAKKNGLVKSYYTIQSVWRNFRAGFSNGSLNQQTSKIHRFLFSRPEWTVEIDFDDDALVNEYLISFAMAMGGKTDEQPNADSLLKYFDNIDYGTPIFKDEEVMQAIRAIQKSIHGYEQNVLDAKGNPIVDDYGNVKTEIVEYDPTAAEIELVQKVASGAEGMMSLQAMQTFADFLQAKESGKPTFTVTMLVGADGKTNGPMLSLFALGAAPWETVHMGGFYSIDDKWKHYSEFKASGKRDVYQDTGVEVITDVNAKTYSGDPASAKSDYRQAMVKFWEDLKEKKTRHTQMPIHISHKAALEALTGPLYDAASNSVYKALRNLVKTPLTAFFFGSTLKNAAKSMENVFIDSWYESIEQIKNSKNGRTKAGLTLQEFIANTNVIITAGKWDAPTIPMHLFKEDGEATIDAAMRFMLHQHPEQEAAFRKGFQLIIGNSVQSAFGKYFKTFSVRRDQITQTVHAAHDIYETIYNTEREKMLAELVKKGEIRTRPLYKFINKVKTEVGIEYLTDLTVEQEAELQRRVRPFWPMAHNAMSLAEDNLAAGLFMGKETKDVGQTRAYTSKVFNKSIPHKSKALSNFAMVRKMINNGVGSLSAFIHSMDSANMHMAIDEVPGTMNVHDEAGNGVDKVGGEKGSATAINKTTSNNLLNFSPAREAYNMLERSVLALAKGFDKGDIDAQTVKDIVDTWHSPELQVMGFTIEESAAKYLEFALQAANNADRDRLTMLTKLAYTDQYTWEGGQYKITPEFRAKAQTMLDALTNDLSGETARAAALLTRAVVRAKRQQKEAESDTVKVLESKPDQETEATEPEREAATSPFGKLGESRIESNAELVALFNKQKSIPVKELVGHLMRMFNAGQADNPQYAYYLQLSSLLYRNSIIRTSAFNTLTVNLVTPDTQAEDVLTVGEPGSMGWYSSKNGEQAIYVLSDAFADSGLTPELMLHELLHGALARALDVDRTSDTKNPLIAELDTLYKQAQAHADKLGVAEKHKEALKNIDEFISWGMTNKAFQDEVLHTLEFSNGTKENIFVSGMKAFLNTIASILFPKTKDADLAKINNGMAALISNVSGLLAQKVDAESNGTMTLSQANTASYSTHDLYDQLSGSISSAFDKHLVGLLDGIVARLHGPAGSFKEQFMATAAGTPLEIWAKALNTGVAPFASQAQKSGLKLSDKELMVIEQVEATMRTALEDERAPARAAYRELYKLYEEVRTKLTAQPAKDADTQALFDFLFKMEANGNRLDYLSRFAALGLGSEKLNSLLNIPTSQTARASFRNQTFSEWLHSIFDNILEWMNTRLTKTYGGQGADNKLNTLVGQLVDIEARRRVTVVNNKLKKNYPAMLDEKLSEGVTAVTGKLEEFGRSKVFQNSKYGVVKLAGHLGSTVMGNRTQHFLAAFQDFRNKHSTGRPDLLASLVSELRDPNRVFHKLLRASKERDKHMMHANKQTARFAIEGFINKGKDLNKEEKDSLTYAALRTDMHSLLGEFNMSEIEQLLADPKALQSAIDTWLKKLTEAHPDNAKYYAQQGRYLAHFMVTGEAKGPSVEKNAGNIARFYSLLVKPGITEAQAKDAEAILDVLVSLYALSYSYPSDTTALLNVLKKENARKDGNGVEGLLHLHKSMVDLAKQATFEGSEALMTKGYVPEIVNQQTDVRAADELTGRSLIDQGYTQLGEVTPDRTDPDRKTKKHLYFMHDAGKEALQTTIMAYQDLSAAGTSALVGKRDRKAVQQMTAAKQRELIGMFTNSPVDPSKRQENNAVPIFNAKGEIVDWVYRMHRHTRDSILQRDNRFDHLMGQLAGSIFDKATVTDNNTALVNALYDMYEADFTTQVHSFINVGPNSSDPEMQEIYRLLPEATKKVVEEIWGKDGMMVHRDLIDISFGYHKLSMANMFTKPEDERTAVENAVVMVVELMFEQWAHVLNQARKHKGLPLHDPVKYARRAAHVIRRSERMWQEVVKEIKNIIIIKSGVVMIGNIASNFLLLKTNGVSWGDMIKDSLIAARGARDYQRDNAQLFQLQAQLDSGFVTGDIKEIEREITRLKDALSRNPVKGMIDNGLMPTIVDDVAIEDDPYSYKSELARKMEKYTSKLNPKVMDVAKTVYMTKDTKLYQTLSQITQLSDFVARYALHQHLTTRAKNPLSSEQAVQEASDTFINYDLPLHRQLQYTDDMGFTMFSKYFIRVQRVLIKLLQEHPGNVLTLMLFDQLMNIPNALDSSILNRLGNNPLDIGAANILTVGDDILIPKLALSLMQ